MKQKADDKYEIVNSKTKEVVNIVKEGDKVVIKRKEQLEIAISEYKTTKERRDFVRLYGNFVFKHNHIHNEITESDEVRLAFISTYVDYDGILKHDSGIPLTNSDLFKIIGASREIFNEWYLRITDSDIITNQDGYLILDKNYYTKGTVQIKHNSHTRVFINAMRNLYISNQGKNLTTLGNVFKILPHISLKYNIVCWHPNSENIIPMTAKELLEILGIDTKNILRTLKKLAKHNLYGKPLFEFKTNHIDYGEDLIKVNAKLFYNGNMKDYPETLDSFEYN